MHPTPSTPAEWIKSPDAKTGREVWQITSAPVTSEAVYFENQAFTADERYLVFRSERGGSSNLWRCDLQTGELAPILIPGVTIRASEITMHPDGRTVLFAMDSDIWRVDVYNFTAKVFFHNEGRLPGVHQFYSLSSDGRRLAVSTHEPDKVVPIPDAYDNRTGSPAHIGCYDLEDDCFQHVLTLPYGFSHLQLCPGDSNLITYVANGDFCWNMDLPNEQRTRTWIVDIRTKQARRFMNPVKYRTLTHESWSANGNRFFFFEKQFRAWCPVIIGSVDRNGGDWIAHFATYKYRLGHGISSPDGRWFIADCQNWAIADGQNKPDNPLLLIDLHNGSHEILCWPNSSNEGGHTTSSHIHPSFSPTGLYVCYTSDVTGTPQVYVVPVK